MIMKYGGAPKWKESNFCSIADKLGIGMRNYRAPLPKHEPSRIVRRGKVLANGDILWMQDGKLSLEKKGN